MNLLGCLDVPSEGSYFLHGRDVLELKGVQAFVKQENTASINLLNKLGFDIRDEVELNTEGLSRGEASSLNFGRDQYGRYYRMGKELKR